MRVTMVVTPGPPFSRASDKAGVLVADDDSLDRVDPSNYASEPVSDASGRITLPVLIPARHIASSTTRRPSGVRPAQRFARSSPSNRARRLTWATSGSRSLRDKGGNSPVAADLGGRNAAVDADRPDAPMHFFRLYFAIGKGEPPPISLLSTPVPLLPPGAGFSRSATHLCQWSSNALASCIP